MTVPYAEVIGDPIAQSKSPLIHGFWLRTLGITGDYRACHVTDAGLADYLAARRADPDWRGCNVTMPHKQAVISLLDALDPRAERVAAVNCIVRGTDGRLTGYNTDVDGVAEPLRAALGGGGAGACLIGAGGAARGAVIGLKAAGVEHIDVFNRSVEKAAPLAALAGGRALPLDALGPVVGGRTVILNASSMGMLGNPPVPIELAAFPADTIVFDMVYSPLETPLLADARRRGLPTIDGLAMLIGQAATAFTRFFGAEPPRGDGDTGLRAVLTGATA